MIRLHPTVISLTMSEVKELENRRRYRRYLQRQENPTSEETVHRKTSPSLELPGPKRALSSSQNIEPSSPNANFAGSAVQSSSLHGFTDDHVDSAEENDPTPPTRRWESGLMASDIEPLTSPDSPSSPERYLSVRPRRPRLLPSSSESATPEVTPAKEVPLQPEGPAEDESIFAALYKRDLSGRAAEEPENPRTPEGASSIVETRSASQVRPGARLPSLPPPFSQNSRRAAGEKTFTLVRRSPFASSRPFTLVLT